MKPTTITHLRDLLFWLCILWIVASRLYNLPAGPVHTSWD